MIANEVGNTETAQIELVKKTNSEKQKRQLRYSEQACLLSNNRIKFGILKDVELRKFFIDLRHLKDNKLTKRGVRLALDEFKEILNIPRLGELLDFYESNK
jgi:hypothetical protein